MSPTTASIIITVFLFYSINSLTHSHGLKIKTRLIHRDSIHSPLYNASETITDRAKRAVQSSLARHAHLSLIDIPPGIEAGLVLATKINLFHVNFSIGQPPVPQLAILDTGSELVWVKCLPCNLCKPTRGETVFDPLKSKTYVPRPCTKSCDNCTGEYCSYEIYYEGGDQSEGIYATDQLTFSTSDDGLVTIPDIQFGCSSLLTGPNILNISDQVFKKMSKQGIMVDSGTDVMILHDEAFEVVMAEIKKIAASSNLTEVLEREDYELCYKGLVNVDARDQFQNMDLQFKDGADLLIDNTGMFIQVDDDTFCLAVLRTMGVSIIGVMAQQAMAFFLFMISTIIFSTSHSLNITVPLIHHDSIYSPQYNASETIEDRTQRVTKASRARHDHLSSLLFSNDVRPQAKLVTAMKTNVFYLNFSIGEPPLPQLALMDTGSAFLLVKCKPCQHEWECSHGPGDSAIYDLTNSETSFELPCLKDCEQCSG
ncbi:Probable aspartic protease At2g35615 [Linum perenne]